jgi:hypothetical protein
LATSFVAPATFLSALLFYFGYVSSRAQFAYFGVDVDTIGLSTRDYVMRSPAALLVPALLFTILGAAALLLSRWAESRRPSASAHRRLQLGAGTLVVLGLAMLVAFRWLGGWAAYPMVTPLLLAIGLAVLVWSWLLTGVRRGAVAFAILALATSLVWATATLAQWTGLGAAQRTARNLDDLPAVVLDTKERLYLSDEVIEEWALPASQEQEFRYRYRNLRLLIQAGDRMFLVPERWTPLGSTLMVTLDDVRVRFRFVNQPP